MNRIILASSSPRRRELITRLGIGGVETVSPDINEGPVPGMTPDELTRYWSLEKAMAVAAKFGPEDIVIAGDTIVCRDGSILGKPSSEQDAFNMLTFLSGGWHTVYTGLTVMRGKETLTEVEATLVLMRAMTPREIWAYVKTGEPMDKAGAYGIQELGALICERVDGDFYNVVGLPLFRLGRMLETLGVKLMLGCIEK